MPKRLTTEEWVNKAKARWEGIKEFDYSRVNYKNNKTPVEIRCQECKEFVHVSPYEHLKKDRTKSKNHGCPKCGKSKRGRSRRKTKSQHIQDYIAVHGDKYDYSKTIYKDALTPIIIICPKEGHGEFRMISNKHKTGQGCKKCHIESILKDLKGKKYGKITFIRKATIDEIKEKGSKDITNTHWWVKCACGREPFLMRTGYLTRKDRDQTLMSCKVCAHITRARRQREEYVKSFIGKQFGFLTVLREWSTEKKAKVKLLCICKCGNTSTPRAEALISGNTVSCGCLTTGSDCFIHYINDSDYANADTILYFVEIRNKYQKLGIASDIKKRFGSDCTDIYYERIMQRAKARAVECICIEWTKSNIPKLPKKWKEWDGNTELRTGLDIQNIINMMDQLAEESEDMTWQELWKKYGLSTLAEPQYVQPNTFQVDTLTSDQSSSSSN